MQSDTHVAQAAAVETYWIHLLAQAALRHGAKDTSWRERLETANQLIRSVPPHPRRPPARSADPPLPGLIGQLSVPAWPSSASMSAKTRPPSPPA